MLKKAMVIAIVFIFLGLVFCWQLWAQRQLDPNEILSSLADRFKQMETKMDKFSVSLDKAGNRDVLMKLDQVLTNQQKILSELEIVKVRASQKR